MGPAAHASSHAGSRILARALALNELLGRAERLRPAGAWSQRAVIPIAAVCSHGKQGITYVAPSQAAVDCLTGTGRMPAEAKPSWRGWRRTGPDGGWDASIRDLVRIVDAAIACLPGRRRVSLATLRPRSVSLSARRSWSSTAIARSRISSRPGNWDMTRPM